MKDTNPLSLMNSTVTAVDPYFLAPYVPLRLLLSTVVCMVMGGAVLRIEITGERGADDVNVKTISVDQFMPQVASTLNTVVHSSMPFFSLMRIFLIFHTPYSQFRRYYLAQAKFNVSQTSLKARGFGPVSISGQ